MIIKCYLFNYLFSAGENGNLDGEKMAGLSAHVNALGPEELAFEFCIPSSI